MTALRKEDGPQISNSEIGRQDYIYKRVASACAEGGKRLCSTQCSVNEPHNIPGKMWLECTVEPDDKEYERLIREADSTAKRIWQQLDVSLNGPMVP